MADSQFDRDVCLAGYRNVLDELVKLRNANKDPEVARSVSIAITNLQTSLLWTREVILFNNALDKTKEWGLDKLIEQAKLDKV